jgi:protease I
MIGLVLIAGCTQAKIGHKTEGGSMNVLMVIAPEDFKDEEYFLTKAVLEDGGAEVTTASLQEMAESVSGENVKVDLLIGDAGTDYDALVFVGGPGATIYFDKEEAHTLAKKFNKQGKVVAAICIAPSVLARAGLLEGKKATAFPTQETDLREHRANYTGAEVEVDGNIVTGKDPDAAEEFAKKILEVLKG